MSAVDSFFAEAPQEWAQAAEAAHFPVQRGGYDPRSVDEAVARLLNRIAVDEHRRRLAGPGYAEGLQSLREQMLERLQRPAGERFRAPVHRRSRGYRAEDADHLCDRLMRYMEDPLKARSITAADVGLVRFRSAETAHTGYEATQTDAFLEDVALQLLLISYDAALLMGAEEEEAAEAALRTSAVHMPRRAKQT